MVIKRTPGFCDPIYEEVAASSDQQPDPVEIPEQTFRDILVSEGLSEWSIRYATDGYCWFEQKVIQTTGATLLGFLHEVAHALAPNPEQFGEGMHYHGRQFTDRLEYLVDRWIVQDNAALRAKLEAALKPVTDEEQFHFEDKDVMAAVVGTEHLKGNVQRMLNFRTSGEKWSLYRAIAKLALASRKG